MTFGEKLILYRKTHDKMTQDELAKIVGTTKQVISRYEKGERTPKIDVVQKYALKLNLPVLYLVDNNIDVIPANGTTILSKHENKVITAYRDNPPVQPVVDKILDVKPENDNKVIPFSVANEKAADQFGFDDFAYAMYGEHRELSEEEKEMLLSMAKKMKGQMDEGKKEK